MYLESNNVVPRSNVDDDYQARAMVTYELVRVKQLLHELKFGSVDQMKLYCDNQDALHIASNIIFHEKTKPLEIVCTLLEKKVL